MRLIFVRPNPDKLVNGKPIQVVDPVKHAWLPPEGAMVQETQYWLRRIADKDVLTTRADEGEVSAAAAPEAAAQPKAPRKAKKGSAQKQNGAQGADKVEG